MNTYCKKCLLPKNYLNIEIDNEGICQHCRNYKERKYLGKEKLIKKTQELLKYNNSKKYDCVIGFSGGRDSTYLLWYVVKKLNLRPLAVFSDDLFIPEIALENIYKTCKTLNVDLRHIKHDNLKKCIPYHLKAWIKRPIPESLMFLNVGERIGYETLVEKEAVKEGVKLIFGGRTYIQAEEKYKTELMKLGNKGGNLSWILGYMKQVLLNPSLASNPFCLKIQYREFMVEHWKQKLIKKNNLTIIHPFFEYIHWVEKDLENILFNELNWRVPDGSNNSARFGCEVDTLRQYLFLKTLGYNDMNVDLSCLIRERQLTKEEAFEKLKHSHDIPEDYIEYILDKASVNGKDFLRKLNNKY